MSDAAAEVAKEAVTRTRERIYREQEKKNYMIIRIGKARDLIVLRVILSVVVRLRAKFQECAECNAAAI